MLKEIIKNPKNFVYKQAHPMTTSEKHLLEFECGGKLYQLRIVEPRFIELADEIKPPCAKCAERDEYDNPKSLAEKLAEVIDNPDES